MEPHIELVYVYCEKTDKSNLNTEVITLVSNPRNTFHHGRELYDGRSNMHLTKLFSQSQILGENLLSLFISGPQQWSGIVQQFPLCGTFFL